MTRAPGRVLGVFGVRTSCCSGLRMTNDELVLPDEFNALSVDLRSIQSG